jgi:hypothetical protein
VSDGSKVKPEIDFQLVNATLEVIAPLIRAYGTDSKSVEEYVRVLLYISAALGDQSEITPQRFKELVLLACVEAYEPISKVIN